MATFKQLPSNNWRVQVRRKGRYVSETFRRRKDGEEWALDIERRIDRGEAPTTRSHSDPTLLGRIVRFAIATAMREEEICKIRISDVNEVTRIVVVRDRKDPRNKDGNDQKVPLLDSTGYDAWSLLQEQRRHRNGARIFPYNSRSLGTAFRRTCRKLNIEDLHFHDLRHEATSRPFEAGFAIEQVALVTGHKDCKMLKRYANSRPESLLRISRTKSALTPPAQSTVLPRDRAG